MSSTGPLDKRSRELVITGGAGFIGSHLSADCVARGFSVTVLTRDANSARAKQLTRQGAKVLTCDLSRPGHVPSPADLPQRPRFIHLAADVSVNGAGLWATNVEGTKRALDLAETLQASHVTVASSIEAQGLGSDAEGALSEDAPPRPVSHYGLSKAEAERAAAEWAQRTGTPTFIVRIGNIYGPGSAWLLDPVLKCLLNPVTVRMAWPQLRHRRFQPLYVADLADGLTRAIEHNLSGLYNLTGEEPVTVEDYCRTLARLLGLSSHVARFDETTSTGAPPLPADLAYLLMGDPLHCHRCYDNGKIRREIGPYGRWSLARGLAATLQWYCSTQGLSATAEAHAA